MAHAGRLFYREIGFYQSMGKVDEISPENVQGFGKQKEREIKGE